MPEINFTLDDLMRELNIDDRAELMSLIRYNKLPEISPKKPISQKSANEIVWKLRRKRIDWYDYKTRTRDALSLGPLEQRTSAEDIVLVDQWFREIVPSGNVER